MLIFFLSFSFLVVKVKFNEDYMSVSKLILLAQICFANYINTLIIKVEIEKIKREDLIMLFWRSNVLYWSK